MTFWSCNSSKRSNVTYVTIIIMSIIRLLYIDQMKFQYKTRNIVNNIWCIILLWSYLFQDIEKMSNNNLRIVRSKFISKQHGKQFKIKMLRLGTIYFIFSTIRVYALFLQFEYAMVENISSCWIILLSPFTHTICFHLCSFFWGTPQIN